mmetsp:Transcript_31261/g.86037  ORF Transcript_31261/g.86037 Transcript_31261/m.86037 type:complete len:213 (-) Transcript_31261:147-785(-)
MPGGSGGCLGNDGASLWKPIATAATALWAPGVAPSVEKAVLRCERPHSCPRSCARQLQATATAAQAQRSATSRGEATDAWAATSVVPAGKARETPEGQCQPPDAPPAFPLPAYLARPCAAKSVPVAPAANTSDTIASIALGLYDPDCGEDPGTLQPGAHSTGAASGRNVQLALPPLPRSLEKGYPFADVLGLELAPAFQQQPAVTSRQTVAS